MRKITALLIVVMMLVSACTGGDTNTGAGGNTGSSSDAQSKAEKVHKSLYSSEFSTLNYLTSSSGEVGHRANDMIDGLIEFDKYDVIEPCAATDWTISEDGLTYTFTIRKGIKWYTCEGKEYGAEVTANDFVDSMKYLLTKENASEISSYAYDVIKNAKKYYDGEITDFSQVGIRAVDDYTLEYTLERPTPYFLKLTSQSCFLPANGRFLEETGELFGTSNDKVLYCGAYIMTGYEPENRRVYEANKNYWNPDSIKIQKFVGTYNKEASSISTEMFLRGENAEINVPVELLDEWMKDPEKSKYLQKSPTYPYPDFLIFNFDPQFAEEYEPDNWREAVNNVNFRKSIFNGFDREAAILTSEPLDPKGALINTITAPGTMLYHGMDYTDMEPLKTLKETEYFNADKAIEYKEKAMKELDGKVTFPVKVVFPYNTGKLEVVNRAQVIEQQLEKLLGIDYIDVIILPYPPTGYSKATRLANNYSLLYTDWGAEYADPASFTDPFVSTTNVGKTYGSQYMAQEYLDADGTPVYEKMIADAKAELIDIEKRYEKFAEAEAFLIENAMILPFYLSVGYIATYLDPFEGYRTQFGISPVRMKGRALLDEPMSLEGYEAAKEKYMQERVEAQKNAKY